MKKMLLLISAILIIIIIQASKPAVEFPPYKGTTIISRNILPDGRIVTDTRFKQHVLLKKAEQWIVKNYDKNVILVAENTITVNTPDYRLLLEFIDGAFDFTFTDKMKDEKKLVLTGRQVIDNLTQYVRTCGLENNSW